MYKSYILNLNINNHSTVSLYYHITMKRSNKRAEYVLGDFFN